jgi:hypothetical protein
MSNCRMAFCIKILGIITQNPEGPCMMTISIMTLAIMTHSIKTLRRMTFYSV